MGIEQRILTCRLLEKMTKHETYSKKIGLQNSTTFHGRNINHDAKSSEEKG